MSFESADEKVFQVVVSRVLVVRLRRCGVKSFTVNFASVSAMIKTLVD